MPYNCSVQGCSNRSSRDRQKSYFRIPRCVSHKSVRLREVTLRRREKWLKNLAGSTKLIASPHARVCSDHFVKGFPGNVFDENDVDWAPTLKLGDESKPDKPVPKSTRKRPDESPKDARTTHDTKPKTRNQKTATSKATDPRPVKATDQKPSKVAEQKSKAKPTITKKPTEAVQKKVKSEKIEPETKITKSEKTTKPHQTEAKPKETKPPQKRKLSEEDPPQDNENDRESKIARIDENTTEIKKPSPKPRYEDLWPKTREREAEVFLDMQKVIRIEVSRSDMGDGPLDFNGRLKQRLKEMQSVACQTDLTSQEIQSLEDELSKVKQQLYILEMKTMRSNRSKVDSSRLIT
ncbi:predicted protein [Nematostella vectensis]|uniref:THAP-type domain-containing protein n=1 Tax=Nematostella vectensis TaxID=45351 RepID=A7SUT7_NEMVE|nr:predicted protein [Nematostella vectensis]|eukprot:XP_001624638.1 predicted protein [Nematostella vectensis]